MQNHTILEFILTAISTGLLFLFGHNFWIAAKTDVDNIEIDLITSDKFPESDSVLKRERIKDFRAFSETDSRPVTDFQAREKTLVARVENVPRVGCAALELYPHPISLEAEKFVGYVASEAAEKLVAPDFVHGETTAPQRESYAKFAKSLLDNDAHARFVGHRLEIVLQSNPSRLKTGEKLPMLVLFDGAPIENLRVSTGAENLNGGKYAAHARTDRNGGVEIEIAGNGLCFARTHLIRRHHDSANYEWESFWASVTFRL